MLILIVAAALTACGSSGKNDNTPASGDYKTLGDIIKTANAEEQQSGYTEKHFVYAYKQNDTFYRAIVVLSDDDSAKLNALDVLDEDYETKKTELISAMTIDRIENLSEMVPSQDELDKWVGKTGKDLFDAGWYNSGWNLNDMVFWMDYGPFQYDVVMEGEVKDPENFEDADIEPLIVKSVTFNGQLGDATDIEE